MKKRSLFCLFCSPIIICLIQLFFLTEIVYGQTNTAPRASFIISPSPGYTTSIFLFDASGTSDDEDLPGWLEVRWDWTNDGIWDTNYSTNLTVSHKCSIAGSYTIALEARDTEGLINRTTRNLTVLQGPTETGTVTDIDGNIYKTVKIGNQWWMAENLKVKHYRNGDPIVDGTGNSWSTNWHEGTYGYPNRDENNFDVYGLLYNWRSADDSRNIAPMGWKVASDTDWLILLNYLGGTVSAGSSMKESGSEHWYGNDIETTNGSGFTALPAGRLDFAGVPGGINEYGLFWSSTELGFYDAGHLGLTRSSGTIKGSQSKSYGFSIRCLKSSGPLNTAPYAYFDLLPSNGSTQTEFVFDASACSDAEDPSDSLKVRWDWNGDGIWDTIYSKNKIVKKQYFKSGTFNVILQVKDKGEEIHSVSKSVTVSSSPVETGTVTDIDGNVYKTVKIGQQWWMAENLKGKHYRNGDPIPNGTGSLSNRTSGAFCYPGNDENNISEYGLLYNWYAVNDINNVSPENWRIPTDVDWKKLEMYLGISQSELNQENYRGTKEGGYLKETGFEHWNSPNVGATNESNFFALPAGGNGDDFFSGLNENTAFWTSTENSTGRAWVRVLHTDEAGITRASFEKDNCYSIRCIRDTQLPIQYSLTLSSLPLEAGIVTESGSGMYNAGSSVILTATPSPGYSFTGWSGDATGSTNPLTVTMDANKAITANFEFDQNNPVVKINLRAILQGCYNTNTDQLSTLLTAESYIPQTSPYCEDQCSVGSIPIDVTDWVLVQLFNSISDAPLVSKSAFLRRDGYLVHTDGSIGINVDAQPGNYFVGLVHRNHITVMTSSAITLSTNEGILYDFTTGADKYYGGNGSVEVESGIWGMWAGDINHDGFVTTRDYKIWFESERAGSAGYLHSDVNLDGVVNDSDYSIWLSNSQKGATSYKRMGDTSGICLSADSLNFGAVAVGDESEKTIYINNTGTATLQITSLNIENTSFSVLGSSYYSIESGSYQDVKVRFTPTSSIHYTAVLQINNNSADGVKEVTLTGTGSEFGTVTDIDGNIYKTVKIGNQWWMAENLKVKHYRNGEEIPYVIGSGSWATLTIGAYCYYDYRDDLGSKYGGLYNWYAVNDSRGLAPEGWHLPSDADWQTLKDYLNGDAAAGGKMKETGEAWASPNIGATNESGFSALPGGEIDEVGTFRHSYTNGKFWYSSDFSNDAAWYCSLYYAGSYADRTGAFKRTGLSVRCIRD